MYREVSNRIDLPAMEREVIDFWQKNEIFHKSLNQRDENKRWVFYEGPPTANGLPGAHHVEARVFKDVFPRFKAMQGYYVPRQAGWDCHGLPVELAVEKELGFSGKNDIEKYGVAEFNAKCKESVLRNVNEFAVMTSRMGYWVDFDKAYWTMSSSYIESVWWSLKEIHNKGLLISDFRVSPYCPRCGTGLSDHELALGYETITDQSIYLRFPVTTDTWTKKYKKLSLLVWTTTPWTVISNTAAAVGPDIDYVVVEVEDEHLIIAKELISILGEDLKVKEQLKGKDLEGVTYQAPFGQDLFEDKSNKYLHAVLLADYVTTEDGTGIVHQSPAFGAEDMQVCRKYGLPVINPVKADGHFESYVSLVSGQFFKKADKDIVKDLKKRELLYKEVAYEHQYPHCWRCHTPLMYYAQPSWYIKTTSIKNELMRENEKTNWFPNTIKHGRYGDWLNNNIDWALSRNRYWGTPLPIWICDEKHQTAVGSLKELSDLSGQDVSKTDPHRPFVDDILINCPKCKNKAKRVPEVIDCWYDSGAMPFAQLNYPQQNQELFKKNYPADFICEAIDQTRGWFYTLMAVGTLVFDKSSYKNVVTLGHILDEKGRKMSKHLGNVLEPIALMDEHGADSVRWFMLASGSPWQARRVGHSSIQEVTRKVLLTYWNTVSFLSLYTRLSDYVPGTLKVKRSERPEIDQWLMGLVDDAVLQVTDALENFDTQKAGKVLFEVVDDMSNWYVRRNRRRFWDADPLALDTLHDALKKITLIMAPFVPFITEKVWQEMFKTTTDKDIESVHLANWPKVNKEEIRYDLIESMGLIRRLVELGRGARAEGKVKNRQPLAKALVSAKNWDKVDQDLKDQLAEELNILQVQSLSQTQDLVNVSVKANFRTLGARFSKETPQIAKKITEIDPVELVTSLRKNNSYLVKIGSSDFEINSDDVIITETPREGWSVMSQDGETIALDLTLTKELRSLGLSREVIRLIQETRKNSGFDVSDRINVKYSSTNHELLDAINEHIEVIKNEVLAINFELESTLTNNSAIDEELNLKILLSKN
ncbi:MAG: isoleucine--tRNA ligase [Candidatus Nanopelagicales bacterium]